MLGMAGRRPFSRDEKVEVKMQDGEFASVVYEGVIKSVWNHRYEVKMTILTDGSTGGPLHVHVDFAYLQPVPPRVLVEFKQYDFVEVWYRRGWWPAVISRKTPFNQFHVVLVDGTRLFVDESELRIHQRREVLEGEWFLSFCGECSDEVEVKLTHADFAGGYYEGVITKTWKRRCEVQLRCLPDNTTGKMMIVRVKYGILRPIPPTVIVEYKISDYVDAWDRQGWWCGVVNEVIGDDVYDVVLLGGKSVRVCDMSVRITQTFTYGNPPKWQYNKH
ncbi:hypothetical protein L1887_39050 [Cichorium endivia]|nr:hypothetical protein L1887_39050 [Cichorium endivia]